MEHALRLDGLLGEIAAWAQPRTELMTSERIQDPELTRIVAGLQRDQDEGERSRAWREMIDWLRRHELRRLLGRIRRRARNLDPMAVLNEFFLGFHETPPRSPEKLRLEYRILDACRAVRRADHGGEKERIPLDTVAETLAAPEKVYAPAPDQAAEASDRVREVDELIDELKNPRHRDVARLRYLEGKSLKEISAALDIPLGTVKSDLNREIKPRLERGEKERSWAARVRKEHS